MNLAVAVALCSLAIAGSPQDDSQKKSTAPISSVQISGRYNPELIPQQMLWESFLQDTATADTDTQELPRTKRINGLSKYTFKIPVEEVEKAVAIAVRTTKEVDRLRNQLQADSNLTMEDRKRILSRSNDVVMNGRDEMARQLSPTSFKAIRSYVTEEFIKGIEVELPANPQ
jgi:hypothetical protein